MNKQWFEMSQFRKRSMDAAVWIPLRAVEYSDQKGKYGEVGYREDFFGCGTLAVPVAQRDLVSRIGWSDLGIRNATAGAIIDGRYVPADLYQSTYPQGLHGTYLVMCPEPREGVECEWIIHPDLLLSLKLYRDGDSWVCPDEGYIEVIKITRDATGKQVKIEMRAAFLKDYLCARQMGLWMTWYRERNEIQEIVPPFDWPDGGLKDDQPHDRLGGRVLPLHRENGERFGSLTSVMHVTRTDVDFDEDVPRIDYTDEGQASTTTVFSAMGDKIYRVIGELWREEWVSPGVLSPRVRGDEQVSNARFYTDAAGSQEEANSLKEGRRWLWFKPEVVNALLAYRGGRLGWYTGLTGGVGVDESSMVPFGVNELGYLNVYAKDIAYIPAWQHPVWAGFNIGPDGKVSKELLEAQATGIASRTQAPEASLQIALQSLNEAVQEEFGFLAFKQHKDTLKIISKCHRFRATSADALLELAKDLARISADALDKAPFLKKLTPAKEEKWGSLKCLEKLVALKVGPDKARQIAAPLFGAYDLRLADAHLPGKGLSVAMANAGIDSEAPFVIQGYMLLNTFVTALALMTKAIQEGADAPAEGAVLSS